MRAIGARQHLPVTDPNFLVEFEADKPEIGPLDILVQVKAVAANPVDTKIRARLGNQPLDTPRILGWDAAGTVEAVGNDVERFQPGDHVFYSGDLTRPGSNAEYQAVDSRIVAHKPHTWSFEEAAAIPLVGLTAWELMLERMMVHVSKDGATQALLIINGAGGVGSALISLGEMLGFQIVATASRPETKAWCEEMGAHYVVNHHQPLRPQCEAIGFDHFAYIANLYDTDAYWEQTADLIAPQGALGLVVEPKNALNIGGPLKEKCVRIAWEFMASRSKYQRPDMSRQGQILTDLADLCAQGALPKLDTRTFDGLTVENLRECHTAMENGTAHGKWTIKL